MGLSWNGVRARSVETTSAIQPYSLRLQQKRSNGVS